MTGLPRAIIRKYGVSKKAWAVFRGRRRHHVSTRPMRRVGVEKMARRKHYFSARTRRYARRVGKAITPTRAIVGAVGYSIVEPMVERFVPAIGGVPAGVVKGGIGYFLAKRGGIIGGVGMAMLTVETYKLARGGFGGLLGGSTSGGYVN